jgi:hypothetical protein
MRKSERTLIHLTKSNIVCRECAREKPSLDNKNSKNEEQKLRQVMKSWMEKSFSDS